jgi:hypothetical protein
VLVEHCGTPYQILAKSTMTSIQITYEFRCKSTI